MDDRAVDSFYFRASGHLNGAKAISVIDSYMSPPTSAVHPRPPELPLETVSLVPSTCM